MIPAGTYRAVAKTLDVRTTQKGTTLMEVMMEILGPECKGQDVAWTGWLTAKAIKYAKRDLATMGHSGDIVELREKGVACLKTEVEIVVEHDEYNGEVRARVKYVNGPGGGGDTDWSKIGALWNESDEASDDIPF